MSISQQNMICIDPTSLITTWSDLQHNNDYDLTAMLQSDLLKLSFTGQNVHVHHCSLNEPCTNKCHLECISQCPALLSVLARTTIHLLHYWRWLDDQPGFTKSPHTCHKQRAFEIVTAWLVHYNNKCYKKHRKQIPSLLCELTKTQKPHEWNVPISINGRTALQNFLWLTMQHMAQHEHIQNPD